MPLHHCITTSLHHCITVLVIWLAPYHQTSHSFALPPATKPVTHLPCPLPPNQSLICLAPCHQTSHSFALPPATKPVTHLPCPLPPNQSLICLVPCHQTSQSFALPPATKPVSHLTCPLPLQHHSTTAPQHHITALVSHLPCPLPQNQPLICLVPCHQTSQSFDLPSTTAAPHHCDTTSP